MRGIGSYGILMYVGLYDWRFEMIGIYFSGTGNSRYALKVFLKKYDETAPIYSIEDADITKYIKHNKDIVFAYSVQYSNIPKMLKDFIDQNQSLWNEKRIFVIATMGLFSGDGAGILARRLQKYGAQIVGGLHLKMPDSIADEKALQNMKDGKASQEGIGFFYHLAGLFGQRLYFYNKTHKYSSKVNIDSHKCVGCGQCVNLCPMRNLRMEQNMAVSEDRCTMCYRCVNTCPKQAITLIGKSVVEQGTIEKYL